MHVCSCLFANLHALLAWVSCRAKPKRFFALGGNHGPIPLELSRKKNFSEVPPDSETVTPFAVLPLAQTRPLSGGRPKAAPTILARFEGFGGGCGGGCFDSFWMVFIIFLGNQT